MIKCQSQHLNEIESDSGYVISVNKTMDAGWRGRYSYFRD